MKKKANKRAQENIPHYDILIIGGGINGAGIARDAAGRGFSVCICDGGDFGGGTSSASTKLVHGGLRYLEHYEFRLVRESLIEREILLSMAPHIIWPLRFVLPYHSGLRPAWLLRLGLFLYDHLGGRKLLPGSRTIDLQKDPAGAPLKAKFRKGFEYSDCWVEDSRLVVLNLRDAKARGGAVMARTFAEQAAYDHGVWKMRLRNGNTGEAEQVSASVIINATGPHVDDVLKNVFGRNDANNVRLVRGSHIVIPRKYEHDRCYILQNSDERIIFAIPFEHDFTLIGTTDAEHADMTVKPQITDAEITYLCGMASEYFTEPVVKEDVIWTYSGVRPLFNDGASKAQEATRDYVIRRDGTTGTLINIFGGKITTYRKLAESIMSEVEAILGKRGPPWTAGTKLPGGDFSVTAYDLLVTDFLDRFPVISRDLMRRLVRDYGTETVVLLDDVKSVKDLGRDFGAGLYEAEIRYLMKYEWAMEAEDVLFRRTKLGLRMDARQISAVRRWMEAEIHGVNNRLPKPVERQ